ncbi:MAG: alpha-amylase/4-alpha-glucanotransferase domain-containing protein [Candidatus Omnitrophota bacterium]
MGKIHLLMVLHNNQPCDNFGWVFEDAYSKSYEPFVSLLEKYRHVKVAMHYSGSLLEWLHKNRPEFVKRLKQLVMRRQVELLTGGFYEPILPLLNERDRIGQIERMTAFIKNYYGCIPKGVWLTERVWDRSLAGLFRKLGLEYTILDDNHLEKAGISEKPVHGYFGLENGLKIFAGDRRLRYIMPFSRVRQVMDYFKGLSTELEDTCLVFADDGEKFGYWPRTYDWVYRRKWLEKFFVALGENSKVVQTVSFGEALHKFKPRKTIDVPPSSYSEMIEWAKGDFYNFFKTYPEINVMRNRMLRVSEDVENAHTARRISTSRQKSILEQARRELYMAQAGCAYWHGVFGGIYLNHLRSGVYRHLINAQNLIGRAVPGRGAEFRKCDMDDDACEELIAGNSAIDLYIKPHTGEIFEIDSKAKPHNLVNTLARRKEAYHSQLLKPRKKSLVQAGSDIARERPVDVRDILGVKQRGLRKYLIYDEGLKYSFSDYLVTGRFGLNDFVGSSYRNVIKLSMTPFESRTACDKGTALLSLEKNQHMDIGGRRFLMHVSKNIEVHDRAEFTVSYKLKNLSKGRVRAVFATESNWSLMAGTLMRNRDFRRVKSFRVNDEWTGIRLDMLFSDDVRVWSTPIYALHESEGGLEKSYQYLRVLVQRPVCIDEGQSASISMDVSIN